MYETALKDGYTPSLTIESDFLKDLCGSSPWFTAITITLAEFVPLLVLGYSAAGIFKLESVDWQADLLSTSVVLLVLAFLILRAGLKNELFKVLLLGASASLLVGTMLQSVVMNWFMFN